MMNDPLFLLTRRACDEFADKLISSHKFQSLTHDIFSQVDLFWRKSTLVSDEVSREIRDSCQSKSRKKQVVRVSREIRS